MNPAISPKLLLGKKIEKTPPLLTMKKNPNEKSRFTYAPGASAEHGAIITIGLADTYGLPISTTPCWPASSSYTKAKI